MIKLNLNRYGYVEGEIIWMSDKFAKIAFKKKVGIYPFTINKEYVELFHISEIFNFHELYQDSNTKIKIV